MTAPVSLALLLRGSVTVGGTAVCPEPTAVQALVLERPGERPRREPDRAELTSLHGGLQVRLLDDRGRPLAERRLESQASCEALAKAAAAVIGAMELEVWAVAGVDEVPLPPPRGATVPDLAVAGSNSRSGRTPRLAVDVGAALFGAVDSSGAATGVGTLALGLGFSRSRVRLESGLSLEGPRDLALDGGRVSYERFWLAVGPGYELRWGRFSLEPGIGLVIALLTVHGDGVTGFAMKAAPDFGGQAGLTAQWAFEGRAIWAGALLLGWTSGTQVQIGRAGQARSLPPWGGLLGLGMRFGAG